MTDSVQQHLLALSDGSLPERIAACDALLQTEAVLPLLITVLHEADVETRWRAGVLLGWLGDPQGIPHLIQALSDDEWSVRHSAVWALGRIQHTQAAEILLNILHAPESEEQVRYVSAMGLINHHDGAVDRLLRDDTHAASDSIRRPVNAALLNPQFREG